MNNKTKYLRSLSFWTTAFFYIKLVQASLEETIKYDNKHIVVGDATDFSWDDYEEKTKWSDFNIAVPLLYNFYHGLELMLKGFILLKKEGNLKLDHRIERLFCEFNEFYPNEPNITAILKKYISPSDTIEPLKSFFTKNNISANKFYEVLRYPVNKGLEDGYDYFQLKYNGEEGVIFFKELLNDIQVLRGEFVILGRTFKQIS